MEVYKLFGPPGTGKTTKMLNLLEGELDSGILPKQVAYMSFTRNAVGEARNRAVKKFPGLKEDEDLIYFRTMHSMAYRVLGLRHDRVAMGEALYDFGQRTRYTFEKTKKFVDPDDIMFGDSGSNDISLGSYLLSIWDFIRNNLWGLDEGIRRYPQTIYHPEMVSGRPDLILRDFVSKYEAWKEDNGLLDFTDFLKRVLFYRQPLWPPVRTIFADEVQDFSPLQWEVLKVWSEPAMDDYPIRLFLAGDDDQAIFTFQGAAPDLFLNYQGVEKVLARSWRLPQAVWEYSQKMIQRNRNRRQKEFTFNSGGGTVEYIDDFEDVFDGLKTTARGNDGSWFVLSRNRFFLDRLAEKLEQEFIPYTNRRGWSPFENRRLVRACEIAARFRESAVTLEELNHLISDFVESQRVLIDGSKQTFVVRGGKKQLELKSRDNPNSEVTRYESTAFGLTPDFFELLDHNPLAVVKFKSPSQKEYIAGSFEAFGPVIFKTADKITLSTIHGSKGEEADHVVLTSDVSNSCHKNIQTDPEGERRVFYVGATRARKDLYLVAPQTLKYYPL